MGLLYESEPVVDRVLFLFFLLPVFASGGRCPEEGSLRYLAVSRFLCQFEQHPRLLFYAFALAVPYNLDQHLLSRFPSRMLLALLPVGHCLLCLPDQLQEEKD